MNTDDTKPASISDGGVPEKYIRTFAGDMETLQMGGNPDLVPLKKSQVAPVILAGEEKLPEPISAEISVDESKDVTEPESLPIQGISLQESEPEPALEPVVPLAPALQEYDKPTPIKTYTDDFSKRLKETHASTATVLAAEQDAAKQTTQLPVPQEPRQGNRWYIVAGIFLFIAGGAGIYIAYSRYLIAAAPVIVAPVVSSPIFVDSRESVSGTGLTLLQTIQQSIDKPLPTNAVRLISFDASTTTSPSVFEALGMSVPSILLRNMNSVGSMAGVVHTSSGQSPFFILSVSSYSLTFSGMLSWEPSILNNLAALFPPYPASAVAMPIATTTPVATSTKGAVAAPVASTKGSFHDEVVSNHDVRVYRDIAGRSIVLYGYWNQSTLVIARDPAAFTEILRRLATPHS